MIPERRVSDKRLKRIEIQNYVLYGIVVGLLVALAIILTGRWSKTDDVAKDLNSAVCTWTADLNRNIDASQKFLKDHPRGVLGIPPAVLQENIRNRKRTLKSFKKVECKPEEVAKNGS